MNINTCKPDYHINVVYCGGYCVYYCRDYNQTLKLFMSEYSKNHMIVSSSYWIDYNDNITYGESKYYCMISNGCVVNISKPSNIDADYGDECVIDKITHANET